MKLTLSVIGPLYGLFSDYVGRSDTHIPSSLAFRGFVLHCFANLLGRSKKFKKNPWNSQK